MKKLSAVFFCALLAFAVLAAEKFEVADGVSGGCEAFAAVLFDFSLSSGTPVSFSRLPAADISAAVREKKISLALVEESTLFAGVEKRFFGGEAVAVYVNILNDARNISPAKLRDIYSSGRPAWSELGGSNRDVHRFCIQSGRPGASTVEAVLRELPAAGVLSLNSSAEAVLLAGSDPEAMALCRFETNYPADRVKVLAVDSVLPSKAAIVNGDYPLCRRYFLVYPPDAGQDTGKFLQYLTSPRAIRLLQEKGLILK